jgi:broad specificity phosphatase PhoE
MTHLQRLTVAALAAVWLVLPAAALAQKLMFVVRHAERADANSSTASTMGADPLLSVLGEARAAKLASMLADSGIKAIFSTEYKRTQDTAKPLAAKLGLTPQSLPASDTAGLVAKIKTAHSADIVLVVGHSNTVPAILKAFGGPDVTVGDNEYDSLFIIVPATGAMTRIRY